MEQNYPPGLYIVATPIGNLRDMTLRALDVLKLADYILCEDTRVSAKLLSHYAITAPTLSYHDHNEDARKAQIFSLLAEGKRLALISDAGTPLISDPGYKLARDVAEAGFYISVLPGASSVLAALCLSGLPANTFYFAGFIPTKQEARRQCLSDLAALDTTLIFFESAQRLQATLAEMHHQFGNRSIAVVREITKRFEETKRGLMTELIGYYRVHGDPKGEVVLVVEGAKPKEANNDDIENMIRTLLQSHSIKEAASIIAEQTGKPRKEIYAQALAIKNT